MEDGFGGLHHLRLAGCGWGDEEVAELAITLNEVREAPSDPTSTLRRPRGTQQHALRWDSTSATSSLAINEAFDDPFCQHNITPFAIETPEKVKRNVEQAKESSSMQMGRNMMDSGGTTSGMQAFA